MNLCYKIVSEHGMKMTSPYAYSEYKLEYALNEITKPKIGRIFVYKNLKEAMIMANTDLDWWDKILLCECDGIRKQQTIYNGWSPEYEGFWNNGECAASVEGRNIYTADWIKPIRILDIRNFNAIWESVVVEGQRVHFTY